MSKRISKLATASDFTTTTTTVSDTAVVSALDDSTELVKPVSSDILVTSKDAVKRHLKALDDAVNSCEKAYLKIAFALYWFNDTLAYQVVNEKNYDSIHAFAKDRYGISKSTTYAYLKIVEKFGKLNPETNEIDALKDEYKNYKSTALIVMCDMDNETLEKCKSNMKVKDLKALLTAKDEDEEEAATTGMADDTDSTDDTDNTDSTDDTDDTGSINSTTDNTIRGVRLLNIETVEELEENREYIFTVMRQILSQKGNVPYSVGVFQLDTK